MEKGVPFYGIKGLLFYKKRLLFCEAFFIFWKMESRPAQINSEYSTCFVETFEHMYFLFLLWAGLSHCCAHSAPPPVPSSHPDVAHKIFKIRVSVEWIQDFNDLAA